MFPCDILRTSLTPKAFPAVVCRFAQFFISPLFDASGADREVEAVHSEHEKNVMSDVWRLDQLDKEISNPNHDYHKFGTGQYPS